jgi:sensor histidine kinase YesM
MEAGAFTGMRENLYMEIRTFIFGILCTHLMRLWIKRKGILTRKAHKQILPALGIILAIALCYGIMMTFTEPTFINFRGEISPITSDQISTLIGFTLFVFLFFYLPPILIWGLIYFFLKYQQGINIEIKKRSKLQIELAEMEAQALRAQMNPHFIFNSLNSIKSLINKNENDTAAGYLTTFSKLIRTLFQNSDKREVSLYEELETCKLYTQLEKMRFGNKVEFVFYIDESLDLKDIKVPALIIQPFIENAIWHGLVPKETGGKIIISVKENSQAVECIIDDNGIGRELSNQYKAQYEATHQSKGIGLTQSRLELDKLLNEREDSI